MLQISPTANIYYDIIRYEVNPVNLHCEHKKKKSLEFSSGKQQYESELLKADTDLRFHNKYPEERQSYAKGD